MDFVLRNQFRGSAHWGLVPVLLSFITTPFAFNWFFNILIHKACIAVLIMEKNVFVIYAAFQPLHVQFSAATVIKISQAEDKRTTRPIIFEI
jgi:hypothetical protein